MNQPTKPTYSAGEIIEARNKEIYRSVGLGKDDNGPYLTSRQALKELKRTIESVKVEQDPERPGHHFYHDMVVDRVLQSLGLQEVQDD